MRLSRFLLGTVPLLLILELSAATGATLTGTVVSSSGSSTLSGASQAVSTGANVSSGSTGTSALLPNISLLTGATIATTTNVMVTSPAEALTVLTRLVQSYEARIQQLEAENTVMRAQLVKARVIKLPIKATPTTVISPIAPDTPFTPVYSQTGTSLVLTPATPETPQTPATNPSTPVPTSVSGSSSIAFDAAIASIKAQYNASYAGFIKKIHDEWEPIRTAYGLPSTALISAYEFVQSGSQDHVFVDIISSPSYSGSLYEWKILYQFDTTSYKRKLIGYFELDKQYSRYITKKGSNPFSGIKRIEVKDPLFMKTPGTLSPGVSTPSSTGNTGSASETPSVTIPPSTNTSGVTITDIQQAYSGKRYLSVISLSNTYLESNPPTLDILRMRYRTFFIIGKYSDSLKDIQKIQSIQGSLDRTIACDAQVIATYSKDQKLIDSYTKICKG